MASTKQNPRYNVISMRVSDEEKEMLQHLMRITRKSLSDIMREALCSLEPCKSCFPDTIRLQGRSSD